MVITLRNGEQIDLEQLTTVEDITRVLAVVKEEKSLLDDAIALAGAQANRTQRYKMPEWYPAAKHRSKSYSRAFEYLKQKRSALNHPMRENRRARFEHLFIDVARLKLTGEMYKEIFDEVTRLIANEVPPA